MIKMICKKNTWTTTLDFAGYKRGTVGVRKKWRMGQPHSVNSEEMVESFR